MTNEELTRSLMYTLTIVRTERDDLRKEIYDLKKELERRRKSCYFCSLRSFFRLAVKKLQLE